jgi:hypothetical protein
MSRHDDLTSKAGELMMFRGSMVCGALVLGLAVLIGAGASQEKKDKAKGQLPAGWKDLNLTAAQKEKVYEVNAQYKTKIDALNKQINELKSQQKKDQVAILTDEQKEQYTKALALEASTTKKKEEKKKEEKKTDNQ